MATSTTHSAGSGESGQDRTDSTIARLRVIAGLLALLCGVSALLVIVGLSVWLKPTEPVGQIISGAVSAIASITAAYFGIKLGNDNVAAQKEQADKALAAHRDGSARAEVYAALLDPAQAQKALDTLGPRQGAQRAGG